MNKQRLGTVAGFVIFFVGTCFATREWAVTPEGMGPVRIGMRLSQLNKALNEKFSEPDDKEERSCFYVSSEKHKNLSFMIIDGRVARIDVSGPGLFTAEGVQVGDSEARALKAYSSRLKVEPHAYNGPEGHYLTLKAGSYGIRFETDGRKIETFYVGWFNAIQYIEGCQ